MTRVTVSALAVHEDLTVLSGTLAVRAVFPRAWHLQSADGRIITVTSGPYDGPLVLRVSRETMMGADARPGQRATLRCAPDPLESGRARGTLAVGQTVISLDGASIWRADAPAGAHFVSLLALHRDLETAVQRAREADRGGLAAHVMQGHPPAAPSWLDRGMREARGLLMALSVADPEALRARARGLLGLGPGLTPSGDDLLCGLIAGLHVLGARASAIRMDAWRSRDVLAGAVNVAAARTTALSRTLLLYACRGVATEPLLHVLWTLGGGCSVPFGPLLGIGHSSGSDMLTGTLLAGKAATIWGESRGAALVASA